ncbi:phospholipase D family protein [Nesterenkonia marinintestina]|uniref:phospholipase D family protein n=1 Tax=Nesterenkonia marinintestina TaxID=2979865 RepID=UPI0021BEB45B|nr:phospholipase D family protein [Nesterenkonia sp. GX14115]
MLDPTSRILLADELTPPRGFRLSRAVGTSFTLDLTAALSIPMAFTAAGLEEEPEKAGIIGALMGVSERIDIFAQSGAWSLTGPTDLVTLLEPALHPVNPIRGIFHPKIWLMEFTDGEAHRYRMISSSRNLTFDHSWDTLISIDGAPASGVEPADQRIADPLAELVEYMIGRSRPGLPEGRRRHLLDFATRLRHTVWDVDQHFDLTFHVLGLPGSTTPDFTATHTLVASPFVTEQGLRTITDRTHQVDLISRTTTLDGLSTTSSLRRSAFRSWVMDGQADDDGEAESDEVTLTGLHAKVISCAFDHRARLFIGSANATEAAWNRNVEVMVELEGRRHELGPDAIRRSLASMLVEYPLSEEPTPEVEEDGLSALEHRLHRLAAVPFGIAITGEGPYRLTVTRDDPPVASTPEIGKLTWHLLSRGPGG